MITPEQGDQLEAEERSDGGVIARIGGLAKATVMLPLILMLMLSLMLILGLLWISAGNELE